MEINEKFVFATCQVEGVHYWPNAPAEIMILNQPHRHIFHVKLSVSVSESDREIEFILLKRWLVIACSRVIAWSVNSPATKSCEMFAQEIIEDAEVQYPGRKYICEVSEDGENGAIVYGKGTQ